MHNKFEFRYPVTNIADFMKEVVEDPFVGSRYEDFRYDPNGVPEVTLVTNIQTVQEADLVVASVRKFAQDALSFNITG